MFNNNNIIFYLKNICLLLYYLCLPNLNFDSNEVWEVCPILVWPLVNCVYHNQAGRFGLEKHAEK